MQTIRQHEKAIFILAALLIFVLVVVVFAAFSNLNMPFPTSSPSASPSPSVTPIRDFNLIINGTNAVAMSRLTFQSQASAGTVVYNDSSTLWLGIPLHRLVVWAESNGVINSSLLTSGYVVKVMGSDGYTIALNGSRVNMNRNIIVAIQANGTALSGLYWPLTLTGSNLTMSESVKGIAQIQITPL